MILGVVLGNIAELNLARAFAITSDLTPFVTRPWSLLFFILAIFSAFFPVYQRDRLTKRWILGYSPCHGDGGIGACVLNGEASPAIPGVCVAGGWGILDLASG